MRYLCVLFALAVVFFPSTASAQGTDVDTGNGLLMLCGPVASRDSGNSTRDPQSVACLYYVKGLVEGHDLAAALTPGGKRWFCRPDGAETTSQYVRVIVKFLEDNPAELHKPASLLAVSALLLAFPCR